jgi:hypothetical protein
MLRVGWRVFQGPPERHWTGGGALPFTALRRVRFTVAPC